MSHVAVGIPEEIGAVESYDGMYGEERTFSFRLSNPLDDSKYKDGFIAPEPLRDQVVEAASKGKLVQVVVKSQVVPKGKNGPWVKNIARKVAPVG